MSAIIGGLEAVSRAIPIWIWEVWGRFGYLLGIALMIFAFGGFTFRSGGRWGLGRERHGWDTKALLSIPLTFALIFVTGFIGSGIVLVPGAQTFESLKDLSVLLCVLLFGYPALIAVPPAYMLSDLIEGVPPAFLQDWFVGYFINPSCFWIAYQLIGKDPDFRRARTWRRYLFFVVTFMAIEPPLWGYICSEQFSAEISYRNIAPALFFTTAVTWVAAPFAMLVALPLAKKYGLFWADIPGRVKEHLLGLKKCVWESGKGEVTEDVSVAPQVLPIRIFLAAPFIALVLLMVGAVAYLTLQRGQDTASTLASRLLREVSETTRLQLNDQLHNGRVDVGSLAADTHFAEQGRVFIVDRQGRLLWSSQASGNSDDPAWRSAVRALDAVDGGPAGLRTAQPFHFDIVVAKPLSHERWLALATPYTHSSGRADWIIVATIAEADYLSGVRAGHSQSAMVVAVALILSLLVAPLMAGVVTAPILRVSRLAHAMAEGDLSQRVPVSRLEELGTVATSFNFMAQQLQQSRQEMDADIQRRAEVERVLRESEERLEELVALRTHALLAANKELEAFSYSISHDLRTPLRAMDGFAKILLRDFGEKLEETGRQHIDRIVRATTKMSEMIECLLDLSKVNRRELNGRQVNLSALAEDVVQELRLGEPDRAVDVSIHPALHAYVDAHLIRQVLQNLVGNAWKFTARTQSARIEFGHTLIGGEDAFYVADNGAGFDMAHTNNLFMPFQRLHAASEFEGTGIGLAIVERIVTRHGGRVWAKGEINKGATIFFTVNLRSEKIGDDLPVFD